MLNGLRFELSAVTPRNFLKRFLKAGNADARTAFLAYVRGTSRCSHSASHKTCSPACATAHLLRSSALARFGMLKS